MISETRYCGKPNIRARASCQSRAEERIGRSTPLPVRAYDDCLAAAITRAAGSWTTWTHSGPPFPARISAETLRHTYRRGGA